jgi:hypothetical protein
MNRTTPFPRPARLLLALAGALTLSALPPAARAQAPDAAASSAAAPATTTTAADPGPPPQVAPVAPPAADALDLENPDGLKGVRRVALAGVAVYVLDRTSGGASAGGVFANRSMAVVNTSVKVTGLDPARLQALADAAHDTTVAALKARGVEVLTADELRSQPAWAELTAAADPSPLPFDAAAGQGHVYSARGLPLFHMDEAAWMPRTIGGLFGAKVEDPFVSLGDKMSGGFRKVKVDPPLAALATAVNAPVLLVRLVLTPAQVKASGGAFSLTASTSARDSLVLPGWTNRLLLIPPKGDRARVSLKDAMASATPPGRMVDVTSTGTKVADIATTALTFAAAFYGVGRGVAQSTTELELRTSPDWFDAVARPQMDAALTGLAGALKP